MESRHALENRCRNLKERIKKIIEKTVQEEWLRKLSFGVALTRGFTPLTTSRVLAIGLVTHPGLELRFRGGHLVEKAPLQKEEAQQMLSTHCT
jgi:hypothetical protein